MSVKGAQDRLKELIEKADASGNLRGWVSTTALESVVRELDGVPKPVVHIMSGGGFGMSKCLCGAEVPLGTSIARWWDKHILEVRNAD